MRSAAIELEWDRAMTVGRPFVSRSALRSILWDIVLVKKIIRSGWPILFFKLPTGLIKTLTRHL